MKSQKEGLFEAALNTENKEKMISAVKESVKDRKMPALIRSLESTNCSISR